MVKFGNFITPKSTGHMADNPRLHFQYTQKEWAIIEKKIKKAGKTNLNSFLRGNVHKIDGIYESCSDCVKEAIGPTVKKTAAIPAELHKTICQLAYKLDVPPSVLVARVILDPLLFGE